MEENSFSDAENLRTEGISTMKCLDLKFYIPSKDYEKSQEFYIDLGFNKNWDNGKLCEFQIGEFRFLLQDFYSKEHAENCMVHLLVDNVSDWYQKFSQCISHGKYPEAKLISPKKQDWGLTISYLTDPTGVLWHIAEIPIE